MKEFKILLCQNTTASRNILHPFTILSLGFSRKPPHSAADGGFRWLHRKVCAGHKQGQFSPLLSLLTASKTSFILDCNGKFDGIGNLLHSCKVSNSCVSLLQQFFPLHYSEKGADHKQGQFSPPPMHFSNRWFIFHYSYDYYFYLYLYCSI